MTLQTLTLWDSTTEPPEQIGKVYTWNGYVQKDSVHSLMQYVETHGERLRSKYLAFIHDLGEVQVNGKRLVEHLDLGDGLSLWWMSLLAEKSHWNSPIADCIRLIALEEILCDQKPSRLTLVSVNRSLHEVLKNLCQKLDIDYRWEKLPNKPFGNLSFRGFIFGLPQPIQALGGLVHHIWSRWPFRQVDKSGWFEGDNSLFFCSYFFNITPGLAEEGHFHSRVWEGLQGLMGMLGLSANWLHHYYPHEAVARPRVAMDWAQRFNRQSSHEGFHTFLDSYLSWRIILRVLRGWIRLMIVSCRLRKIKSVFCLSGSFLSLWPFMKRDWYASMRGWETIKNLLFVELFDRALDSLPHQKKGFYLCENIAWERALIHAWRKHGHGELVAVAHGAGRFWDLRYFNDLRVVKSSKSHSIPQADLTALYSKAAVNAYLSIGYPEEAIVECEALRNGYLCEFGTDHSSRKVRGGPIKVLIFGEYASSGTIKMMQLLEKAVPYITTAMAFTLKPHPNYHVNVGDYPSLNLKVVSEPLEKIMCDFDIAYSAPQTSLAVDAYIIGLAVIVGLDEVELNQSPLRGKQGVCFVSTAKELADALQASSMNLVADSDRKDFYFLDPELSRWKRLLLSATLA